MDGKKTYTIELTPKEVIAIRDLLKILDDCPIPLTNDDFVEILWAISYRSKDVDNVDGLILAYKEDTK